MWGFPSDGKTQTSDTGKLIYLALDWRRTPDASTKIQNGMKQGGQSSSSTYDSSTLTTSSSSTKGSSSSSYLPYLSLASNPPRETSNLHSPKETNPNPFYVAPVVVEEEE